ncbi:MULTISPECIES: DNA gyrase subunit A [Clostridiaceae]|uniref:DNA gyrase subunit A n=1 Tax=Clostridium facile TaxID=2763035 RepID=A0ABR7IT31_9CLOT|nr:MULTISPECIES: DNA gyrase subunit A [Clostridiaceae]MBC5788238.1 DNA gyrase subunit A [Clostridium facile]
MSNENTFDPSMGKVIPVDIEKEMRKSFLDYSMSVIVSRALPDVRDGLKPVHRRILYTLYENGIFPDKPYRKSADTVGSVLGRYHPHGDASVYDALVRMAQDFSLRYPLVDGHGNFGSVDGDPPAAYRYTEAKMSKISMEMLTNINKDTVEFGMNYDDRLKEPTVLPSRFPNLLVNGSTGIAVGMATNIPPHNLNEIVDGICMLIDNPDAELLDLMGCIKGPDFPTAGIIMGQAGIRAAYATGRGKITVRSRADVEEMKNGRFRIVVTELPYQVNKARLIESIANHVKDKKIEGISGLRDESSREGMRIVIELKRDANPQIVLNKLYSYTQMQETFGVINLALVNGEPKVMSLKEMLQHYIDFQAEVIRRRTEFDLRKAKEREHVLEGLKIALDFIEEVIKIIRSSKTVAESKERLMENFNLDDIQATAIVQMRLGQLSGLERIKIEQELADILAKVKELEHILSDYQIILGIVRDELLEIKQKYGDERRTEIKAVSGEVDIEDLIPEEECVVTLTHYGYIKRQPVDVYKTQKRGGRGVSGMKQREEDFVEELFISSTHDHVVFITNRGKMYRLKCYEIPEGGKTSKGMNIVNLLPLEPEEKVTSMLRVTEFDSDQYIVMVTKQGIVKRTKLDAYRNIRKNGLIAITLSEDDELAWVRLTSGHSELIVATKNGMAIRFKETDARPLSRSAKGVRAIKLKDGDQVVGMARIREGATVMTVTDKGQGRRTAVEEYRCQTRGGFGKINYKVNEEKGHVVGVKVVDEDDDLIMISDDGVIIRIRVSDVSVMSRYAGGVRVMRVQGDTKVVTFARAEHEEEAEVQEVEQAEETELSPEEKAALEAEENQLETQMDGSDAADELLAHAESMESQMNELEEQKDE